MNAKEFLIDMFGGGAKEPEIKVLEAATAQGLNKAQLTSSDFYKGCIMVDGKSTPQPFCQGGQRDY